MKQQRNLVATVSILLLAGCEMFATEKSGNGNGGNTQPEQTSRDTGVATSSNTSGGGGASGGAGGTQTQSKTQSASSTGTNKTTSSSTGTGTGTKTGTTTGTGTGSKTNTVTATVTKTISTEPPLSTNTQCQPTTFTTKAATGSASVTPISGGTPGNTTRYWDCCKPTCSWKDKVGGGTPASSCSSSDQIMSDVNAQSSCNGGPAYACSGFVPWDVSPTLSYGWAAANLPCGNCYQLDFTGESSNTGAGAGGVGALKGKSMIVQIMNTGSDVKANQFDLLIPGGGVGLFNGCSQQWGKQANDLGEQYGGFVSAALPGAQHPNNCGRCAYEDNAKVESRGGFQACILRQCNAVFGSRPGLIKGCEWFVRWFNAANNPTMTYKQVTCPAELTARWTKP